MHLPERLFILCWTTGLHDEAQEPRVSQQVYLTCFAYCPRGILRDVVVQSGAGSWHIHMVQSGATIVCSCRLLLYSEGAKVFPAAININPCDPFARRAFVYTAETMRLFHRMQSLPIAYKSGVPLYAYSKSGSKS